MRTSRIEVESLTDQPDQLQRVDDARNCCRRPRRTKIDLQHRDTGRNQLEGLFRDVPNIIRDESEYGRGVAVFRQPVVSSMCEVAVVGKLNLSQRRFRKFRLQIDGRRM